MDFEFLNEEKLNELKEDMSKHQKEVIDRWKKNPEEAREITLKKLMFEFDREMIERMLEKELEVYLEECSEENRKNGYTKDVEVISGDEIIKFNRPRLRKETGFDSIIIPKRKRIVEDLENNIMYMYSKNISVKDTKEIVKKAFNIDISTGYISKVVQGISEEIEVWRNKELEKCYFTINIDCTYITIKDQKHLKKHKVPVYVAIGTKLTGYKEVVGMYLGNEDEEKNVIEEYSNKDIGETKTFWLNIFEDLKDRGLEKVLYVISDGLVGIEDAIETGLPGTTYQRCIVHIVRNLNKIIPKKDSPEIIKDFKKIYTAPIRELAISNYNDFVEKYKSKKTMLKYVENYMNYILPLFNVPENIRKYIYTNNIVESANSKIKRGFYGRGALPNVSSAINIVYFNLRDLEEEWNKKTVNNWENIKNELYKLFYDDIKEYL